MMTTWFIPGVLFSRYNLAMNLIVAIIQPIRLAAVQHALREIGVERMTAYDALGYGRQGGRTPMYRGHEYQAKLLRKVVLEIAVHAEFVERAIEAICESARTQPDGHIGDGKIFVLPMGECIQISDANRGSQAI